MTAPEPVDDTLRVFTMNLSPAARHHFELDQRSIPLIHAAARHATPADLARIVGSGIGWHNPANPAALMRYRLAREAHDGEDAG